MTLAEYRKSRGITLAQCAAELGLSPGTKGHLSRLENGALDFPVRLALQVEEWSRGEVRAVDLLAPEDAALLRSAISRSRSATADA